MKITGSLPLIVLLLCLTSCDKFVSYFRDEKIVKLVDPSLPVIDLNERAGNNKILARTQIEGTVILSIEGPEELLNQVDNIRTQSIKAVSFIRSFYGNKATRKINFVFIDGRDVTNYCFKFSRKNGFTHLILYSSKEEILSSFSLYSLVRDLAFNLILFRDISDGNCFEVGISEYVALQYLKTIDNARYKKRARAFAEDFVDSETRKELWNWYNDNGMNKATARFKKKDRKELELYYNKVDKFYRASGGIYLYLEELLGREACYKAINTLVNKDFVCQDDVFSGNSLKSSALMSGKKTTRKS